MVLCVKYRKRLIYESEKIKFFNNVCMEIGMRYWFEFDAIGTDGDHVHIFVGAAPRYSPSRVMQIVKSITAREFFKQYPEVRKILWGAELWTDGGHIDTVSEFGGLEKIKRYVQEQGGNIKQLKLVSFN